MTLSKSYTDLRRTPGRVSKGLYTLLEELDERILESEDFTEVIRLPPDALAADTWERAIFVAPDGGVVSEILVIPDSDIGQATNYMTLEAFDKGADGTGTTSLGSRAVNSTNTIEGMVGVDLVSSNKTLSSGRVVSLKKTVTADGQAFPGGIVKVRYTRT